MCHCAPVLRIHSTASRISRVGIGLRPGRPSAICSSGKCFAVQVLKTPLIMVLGREACGAVDATIKSLKDGTTLPGHLPSLVAALKPAVDAVQGQGGDTLV